MKNLTEKIEKINFKKAVARYWRYKNRDYLIKYKKKTYPQRKAKILEYNKRHKAKTGFVIRDGYKYIAASSHPDSTKTGFILLHRLIMENQLKRRLTKEEIIHHKDGNKSNNNLKNLKLLKNQNKHAKIHIQRDELTGKFMKEVKSHD